MAGLAIKDRYPFDPCADAEDRDATRGNRRADVLNDNLHDADDCAARLSEHCC